MKSQLKYTTPYKGKDPYIFISYSHKNINDVFPVIEQLQKKHYRVWYDEGIDPGTEWDENIAQHIEQCGFFIAFLSQEYISSSNCRDELNFARDRGKKRLLVYLHDVELPGGMSMRLSRLQAIHMYAYASLEDFLQKLCMAPGIDSCLGGVEQIPSEWDQMETSPSHMSNRNEITHSIVSEVLEKVGRNGCVVVEESFSTETWWELVSGMTLDRGCISPYMLRNSKEEIILDEVSIFITNREISKIQEITPLLDLFTKSHKNLLVIATDLTERALAATVKRLGEVSCVAIKAPGFGDRRLEILRDIAVFSGGTALILEENDNFEPISLDWLGYVEQARITKDTTVLIKGAGDLETIQKRIDDIRQSIKESVTNYDREKLQERMENLTRKVAVIKVGGSTVEDALGAKTNIEQALKSAMDH